MNTIKYLGVAGLAAVGLFATLLGTIAMVAAVSNIVGGFLITERMLRMFKTRRSPRR